MGLIADIHKDLEIGALQLIAEYRTRLHDEAVKLCGDGTQVDDLVFRTFEQVLTKVDSYKVDTNLFGWMKSIMENIHRNDTRGPVVRCTKVVPPEELEQYAGFDSCTDEQVLRNSDCEMVRKALRNLPPEYKQTVILRFYEELSLKEIASFLNKPVGTVSRHSCRPASSCGQARRRSGQGEEAARGPPRGASRHRFALRRVAGRASRSAAFADHRCG